MQLGPREHEPQMPDVEVAFDDLNLVDPHLRLPVGVASVKVRMAVIVVVHRDHDPEEAANRRHDTGWCRPGRSTPGLQPSRRRGRATSHQSASGSPCSRAHSRCNAACSQAPPPEPQNDHSF